MIGREIAVKSRTALKSKARALHGLLPTLQDRISFTRSSRCLLRVDIRYSRTPAAQATATTNNLMKPMQIPSSDDHKQQAGSGSPDAACSAGFDQSLMLSMDDVIIALQNIGLGSRLVNDALVELGYRLIPFRQPNAPKPRRPLNQGGSSNV